MKAHEAREIAHKVLDYEQEKHIENIYKTINSAVMVGQCFCYYLSKITNRCLLQLKEDGYSIEHDFNPIRGHTYTIKW